MHIAQSNFYLLSVTGPKLPPEMGSDDVERAVTNKPQVIDWLRRSLGAVEAAHARVSPADLHRRVKVYGRDAEVDGIYLRILIHANEHMGQLVAYARINGIVPPWSRTEAKK